MQMPHPWFLAQTPWGTPLGWRGSILGWSLTPPPPPPQIDPYRPRLGRSGPKQATSRTNTKIWHPLLGWPYGKLKNRRSFLGWKVCGQLQIGALGPESGRGKRCLNLLFLFQYFCLKCIKCIGVRGVTQMTWGRGILSELRELLMEHKFTKAWLNKTWFREPNFAEIFRKVPPSFPEIPREPPRASPSFPEIPRDSPSFPEFPRDSPRFPPRFPRDSPPRFPEFPRVSPRFPEFPRVSPRFPEISPRDSPEFPRVSPSFPEFPRVSPRFPEFPRDSPIPRDSPSFPEFPRDSSPSAWPEAA